jgi:hypothetical protein
MGSATLHGVPSLFRRRAEEAEAVVEEEPEPEPAPSRPRAHTPSKKDLGKATPKRKSSGRVAEPPPANRREAMKRMREKQRASRLEARQGMREGKEEYMLRRDKGPDRALVRDIVDARRNVASYFLPGAFIVILGSSGGMPPVVQLTANLFWFLLAVAVVVDSVWLSRIIKRKLGERFPKEPIRRGTYWYAIMRSLSFRRIRIPGPKVKVGEKV